jgi:hypothetical protein
LQQVLKQKATVHAQQLSKVTTVEVVAVVATENQQANAVVVATEAALRATKL